MTSIFIFIALLVIIIGVIVWQNKEEYNGAYGGAYGGAYNSGNYRTLATQYDNPLFSPCISKRCSGGPYMFTNNPYMQSACASMDPGCLACKECMAPGYSGKVVNFEYSQLSDGCWGNTRCNTTTPTSLCVL